MHSCTCACVYMCVYSDMEWQTDTLERWSLLPPPQQAHVAARMQSQWSASRGALARYINVEWPRKLRQQAGFVDEAHSLRSQPRVRPSSTSGFVQLGHPLPWPAGVTTGAAFGYTSTPRTTATRGRMYTDDTVEQPPAKRLHTGGSTALFPAQPALAMPAAAVPATFELATEPSTQYQCQLTPAFTERCGDYGGSSRSGAGSTSSTSRSSSSCAGLQMQPPESEPPTLPAIQPWLQYHPRTQPPGC